MRGWGERPLSLMLTKKDLFHHPCTGVDFEARTRYRVGGGTLQRHFLGRRAALRGERTVDLEESWFGKTRLIGPDPWQPIPELY